MLRNQRDGLQAYTREWDRLNDEITQIEERRLREQERIEDAVWERGEVSREDRRAQLEARLANEVEYSEKYMEVWRQLQAFDEEDRRWRSAQRRRELDDLAGRRADMASLYVEARRQADQTGEDFQAVLDRLRGQAEADAALQAEAERYAMWATPTSPGNPGTFGHNSAWDFDLRSFDTGGWLMPGWTLAYNGTGAPERVGGGDTTINFMPGAEIRENVDLTIAAQQLAVLRATSGHP